jgi:hypothetical protein
LKVTPTWHPKYINDPKIASDAARSPHTSAEDLTLLATSQHIFVREAVASNPNTPLDVIKVLFPYTLKNEHEIRLALSVINNSLHGTDFYFSIISTIKNNIKLFARPDYYQLALIQSIASHPQVKINDISLLLDPNFIPRHIRHRIVEVAIQEELLIKLSQDPAERIRNKSIKRLAMLKEIKSIDLKAESTAYIEDCELFTINRFYR